MNLTLTEMPWGPDPARGLLRFSHEAMATTFEIFLCHPKPAYAGQAANEAFGVLDRLERQLSRFADNSDISRVNTSKPGESVVVGPEAFECLQQARAAWALTGGAFDVTARASPPRERPHGRPVPVGMDLLHGDEGTMTWTRLHPDVQVDLGGIGKGYALDKMAQSLDQWGIKTALLHGGASTVLALEPPQGIEGWPVTIHCPFQTTRTLVRLAQCHGALSGSAQVKHKHVIDPHTGLHAAGSPAAWSYVASASGALADALSTAFSVMEPVEVQDLCAKNTLIGALLIQRTSDRDAACQAISLGRWPSDLATVLCRCP